MEKIIKNKRSIFLVISVIYFLLTVLALVSNIHGINEGSTVTFNSRSIMNIMWWPILIIILLGITYVLYIKKEKLGVMLELIIGLSMLINNLVNMLVSGFDSFVVIFSYIFPTVLIAQALIMLWSYKGKEKTKAQVTRKNKAN